jgi:hypothetical protein
MLSGVGPTNHLAEFNIMTMVDNPAVGSRMANNPTKSLWVLTSEEVEVALIQVVGITSFGSYIKVSSGQAEALYVSMVLTKWSTQVDRPGVCPRISTLSKVKAQAASRKGQVLAPESIDDVRGFVLCYAMAM